MPITRIFWGDTSNQDIHVLRRETTRDLTQNGLRFVDAPHHSVSAATYLAAHNDVDLIFTPLFNGTDSGDVFSGQGIQVNSGTGQVTVEALPRPLPKNNFIIEVQAIDQNAGPDDDPLIDTDYIRVHIHTSVSAVALTPATLTIRPAAATRTDPEDPGYRFTVRAKFDDGTMGDLTENHGVTWSSTPPGHVDENTGALSIIAGDADGDAITITATLPAALGGGTAIGTMKIAKAWRDEPDIPTVSIIVGGGWPGTTLPDAAPNVLFLADGYTGADEGAFSRSATTVVHHLKTDGLLRPYDLLCTSMNFFRVFFPATTRGISFRCEVYDDDGHGAGKMVPLPTPPEKTGNYSLANLVYAVGLPVPKDGPKTVADLRSEWDALVGNVPHARIPDWVVQRWAKLSTRAFVEELDNFPASAVGDAPAANKNADTTLTLHPDRGGRDGLNSFLAQLQSVSGVQFGAGARLGTAWATPPLREDTTEYELRDIIRIDGVDGMVFICTTAGITDISEPADYAGADSGETVTDGTAVFTAFKPVYDSTDYVVVLSSFPGGRAQNVRRSNGTARYVAAPIVSDSQPTIPLAPSPTLGFTLQFTVPGDASVDSCRTMAHELGHSFGLGDEYVENNVRTSETEAQLSRRLNLQTEIDTQNAAHQVDGGRIRWNWHRVHKAAVIRAAAENVAAGTYKIPVIAGQSNQFAKDDIVRLRARDPGSLLDAAGDVTESQPLQIAVAPSAAATADYLVVQAASGPALTDAFFDDYAPGSILFAPVPAASSVHSDAYPFARMVAKNVEDLITKNHNALYRRPKGLGGDEKVQHPKLDGLTPGLPGVFCFRHKERIVGLYEGGSHAARGMFHPTGICMMRNHHDETAEFCAVCRYVMVDHINPYKHFEIDRDYDDIYPLK
jgi:hypothetical protein